MTLRMLETPASQRMMMATAFMLEKTGQSLFQPPNVKGWPGERHWITSTAIFARYEVASAMANGVLGEGLETAGFQLWPGGQQGESWGDEPVIGEFQRSVDRESI